MSFLVNMVVKSYNGLKYYVRKYFKFSDFEEPNNQPKETKAVLSSLFESYENDLEMDSDVQRNRDQRNDHYLIDSQREAIRNLKIYFMERSVPRNNCPEINDQSLIGSDASRDEIASHENSTQRSPETAHIDHRSRIEDEAPRTDVVVIHNSESLGQYENERVDLHRATNNNQLSATETGLQDSEDSSDESTEEDSTSQIEADTVSQLENAVYEMKQSMILMEQQITYLTEENERDKENLQVHELRNKKEIEKLTIENKSLIENNSDLNIQIETFKQKLTELDTSDTDESVDCDLAELQKRVHQLDVQKYNLIETDSMQREIDNLKIKLTKTNDDMTTLRAQLQSYENQSTSEVYMAKIEKVLKKYEKQKILIKNIEKNVTDNTAHLHHIDHTVNVLLMTGLTGVRERIHVERTWTPPPQQFTGGYGVQSVVSTTLTNSALSPTNLSMPSPPPSPAFVQSDNTRNTLADVASPSPAPPPPPPSVPAVPGAPKVYDRIPITDDILRTVTLKPVSERQLKSKTPTPPPTQ